MRKLRFGFIGAGRNARALHLPALREHPEVEVLAVANRSRESGAKVAAEFGIPHVHDSWRSLLERDDLDAVVVGTWPALHAEMALAGLESGLHVLVEARLAANAGEARAVREAARQRPEQVIQVVPDQHSIEVDQVIGRLVREELGELTSVEGAFHDGDFPDASAQLHWREDPSKVGNNMLTVGRRYEMLLRWLPEIDEVFAAGRHVVQERHDPATGQRVALEPPDLMSVVGRYPGGALLSATFSRVVGHAGPTRIILYGSHATIQVTGRRPQRVVLARRGEMNARRVPIWPHEQDLRPPVVTFVEAVQKREPVFRTTIDDAVRYMEFTDAVHRSLRTGRMEGIVRLNS